MTTFDYTSRDYASIQTDLFARASRQLPEWTSREASDFGVLMVDLWAYMGDVLHYYVDRAAGESFLGTATQRESVLAIANLLDYVPAGRRPATASIQLNASNTSATDTNPVFIPKRTRFLATPLVDTANKVVFTSDTAIAFVGTSAGASANIVSDGVTYNTFPKTTAITLAVTEGEWVTETYTSTGLLNQRITLRQTGVVTNSITVSVNEGAGATDVAYSFVDRIIQGTSSDKVYSVDITADNYSIVGFGNNVNGFIPTINSTITITYRKSRGSAGNVVIGAIKEIESYQVPSKPALDGLVVIPNTSRAVGGVDIESISSLKSNIPAAFRSQDRAVSLQDYKDLVLRVPGIVRATSYVDGSTVRILATTEASDYGSTNTLVLTADEVTRIEDYLEPREITFVTSSVGASVTLTPVNITGTIQVKDNYIREKVNANVVNAIYELFSFDNALFGNRVSLGQVYRAILDVDGVDYAVISRFTTTVNNVIDSSGGFTGVQASATSMLVLGATSAFTLTPSGGVTASGG
jgi:hypothetical protein